jgi:hypothetical protein
MKVSCSRIASFKWPKAPGTRDEDGRVCWDQIGKSLAKEKEEYGLD